MIDGIVIQKKKLPVRKKINQIILHTVMIISLIAVMYPLCLMVFGAFKSKTTYDLNKWLPAIPLRVMNIADAFNALSGYIVNTLIVAFAGIAGMIFFASMAAFSVSKLKFIGNKLCFGILLAITMLPGVLSLTPQLLLYKTLGLDGSLLAMIVPMWTGGTVWGVFLLRGFYAGLPNEIFEAADIDGAGAFQKFILIGVPLSMPIISTLIIMQITSVWSDYMWPKLIVRPELYPIAAGLTFVYETSGASQTLKYAGYLVASIPVICLFVFFNRFYVEGLASSGIKL